MKIMRKIIFLILITLTFLFTAKNADAKELASGSSAQIEYAAEAPSDSRVRILETFLGQYNSPLREYAPIFIKYADQYNIDWRMVAAISGVESTFGQQIPYGTYNGWGWGIYGDNMIYFKSWDDAIKTVSQGIRENYINRWGASNVYEIGRLYAASPTWASRVDFFMNRISDFALRSPQNSLPLSL